MSHDKSSYKPAVSEQNDPPDTMDTDDLWEKQYGEPLTYEEMSDVRI